MRNIERRLAALALAPLLAGCGGPFLRVKPAYAGPASGLARPLLLEDFGAGGRAEGEANRDYGAAGRVGLGSSDRGGRALRIDYRSGRGSWGATARWRRGWALPEAAQARQLLLRAWAPRGALFSVGLREGADAGGDAELWLSPDLKGEGRWKLYGLPLRRLYRCGYDGRQDGNARLDAQDLAGLELAVGSRQGEGSILLDEVALR